MTRARPQFKGHHQPHLPADLGFYDLRLQTSMSQHGKIENRFSGHKMKNYLKSALVALRRDGPARRVRDALKSRLRGASGRSNPFRQSETSKCRARLAPHCSGSGVDLGPGGDPITPHAIRVDLPHPYAHVGTLPVQLLRQG